MTYRAVRRAVSIAVVLASLPAAAEDGAWHGFHSLGVAREQLAPFDRAATAGLHAGGLFDDIVSDDAAARCLDDLRCYCASLRERGLRYGAYGSLGQLGDLWTIELSLVDAHACTLEAATYASEELDLAGVTARIAALAKRLATPAATVAATATGRERAIDATPAIVTTFTRSQLRGLQIRTLEDLLPLIPGFDVVDANWGGLILNQGLQNTLLFLEDGIPLVNAQNNFRWLDRDFRTSFADISRIEIVRGPGSVLWGRNAFLGVVNLIGEQPTRREATVEAGATIGSLDTEEAWARASQNRGSYGFSASVDAGRRRGPVTTVIDSPQAVLGVSPVVFGNGGSADPAPDTWFEVSLRLSVSKRLEALFKNRTSDIQYEISPRGPLLDPGQGGFWQKTHRLYALIGTQPLHDYDNEKLTLRAQLSRYEYYSWENFAVQPLWADGPVPADPTMRDYRLGLRSLQGNREPRVANQAELRINHDYQLEDAELANHLSAGLGVLHLQSPDSLATLTGIAVEPPKNNVSFTKKTFFTLSAFALEELVPLDGLGLSAGARAQADDIEDASNDPQWKLSATAQGGVVFERGPVHSKLIYAQGFRPPDAVSLYSTVGTLGNPDLQPERSQELAFELTGDLLPELTLRIGGNATEISHLIVLVPVPQPSMFLYTPQNKGSIDLASAFVEVQLHTDIGLDAFANYHYTWMQESDPLNNGIPLAPHTAAFGLIWRPAPDLSIFVRGGVVSPRRLDVITAADPKARITTDPTIRSAVGASLANAIGPVALDVACDNPLFLPHDSPYELAGAVNGLVERRRGTEVFATLRYDQ